jgi:glycosyltransferase involved in cell wall biosynthesis
MYIVYATYNIAGISGGHRVITEHVNRLINLGHRVEIWNLEGTPTPYFESNVSVHEYDLQKLDMPDVLVMTDPIFLQNVFECRKKRNTYLLLQHDTEWVDEISGYGVSRSIFSDYATFFNDNTCTILVVSEWLGSVMREKYGIDSTVIENGVNEKLFYPTVPALQFDDPIILLFYDAQNWKGFETLIDAVYKAQDMVPNLKIVVIGPYYFHFPATDFPVSYLLPMLFINKPKQSELASIYASARVFISASWKEGFGLPSLEAMACGVPVVTTDAGGNMDYVRDGYNALVVEQKNADDIAMNIQRIIDDSNLHKLLRTNGLRTAKKFNWDTSISKLEAIFKTAY